MARTNERNRWLEKTHEGAPAARMTTMQALRRSVCSCFLWEKEFYEDGQEIATRIMALAEQVTPQELASLAIECRTVHNLRHVPLLLLCCLAKTSKGLPIMRETVPQVIKRADELTELAAMWWKLNPDTHLPHNMEKGLRAAWSNFGEYALAKYDRDNAVKLRDVMRLTHPKAATQERNELYKRVIDRTMTTPDTWEVELSAGADKKETFERLISEGKLGYLALLRNLRNMSQAKCDRTLVMNAITARMGGAERVLPFRYVAAARAAPEYSRAIDFALLETLKGQRELPGLTAVLVDVSGSMSDKLSARSDLSRMDAAATLASIIPGDVRTFTFSNHMAEVHSFRGLAGISQIIGSQPHGGTQLGNAINTLNHVASNYDRLIVITDEQSHDYVPEPSGRHAYMINVASNKNGVGYGKWTHIDGFSENVLKFIMEIETQNAS